MLRKSISFCLLFVSLSMTALAQYYPTQYRPPNQHWQYLETPHFKIIYARGNDSTAMEMGRILEEQYRPAQNLVGGELQNFPVILNDYNDRSNGFVSPFHFRSEIELPPIKGKSLNPQTGNWLENVGPHELVHAMQFSNLGEQNITQFVSLFSPDIARSFHGAIPSGILEGIAVHHETKNVAPDGGRGNYPIFTNQFDAVFNSNGRWSMGQLVHSSAETRPFARHYIGGYEFTAWLQHKYGPETTKNALDFYMDWPFLGYGVALRHVTGQWPGELYDQFNKSKQQAVDLASTASHITELKIPFDGSEIRRPKWLSRSELIFYGSFYNARPGFYRYDLTNNKLHRILTTNSVGDYRYDLSDDRSEMVYSYYETNAIYDNTTKAELVRYNLANGSNTQLTSNGRIYAPVFSGDSLLALQTAAASSKLISVAETGKQIVSVNEVLSLGDHEIKAVASNPVNEKLAIVVNKRGMQALWIADPDSLQEKLSAAPDISFQGGSVFDPHWHADGQKLLFSSDFSGTYQLYEFDLNKNNVRQITDSNYNAFEGSYSPDGNRIAFIRQQKNERVPAIINRSDFFNKSIDRIRWQSSKSKLKFMARPTVGDSLVAESKGWKSGEYSTGFGWLKPRTVLPFFEEVSNRDIYQIGLSLHSNSLLADQKYSAELTYLEQHGWYDISYQNKTFYPGFKIRLFNEPSYVPITIQGISSVYTLLRQERSLALSVPIQYRINQNIFNTSFYFEPEIRQSQFRYHDISATDASSDFVNISVANLYSQFNYRLQQNIRDLQPNSGLTVYAELEHYLTAGSAQFSIAGQNLPLNFREPTALRGGLFTYLSPLRQWNQSLRLGVEGITQTNVVFNNQSVVSDGFSEPILPGSQNLLSFSTRYTIPLGYVDDGGFLFPLYLSNVYLVAFSNTIADPSSNDWYDKSRSVFGLGIRAQFRLSNLTFNLGVGIGYEPSRNNSQLFIGDF